MKRYRGPIKDKQTTAAQRCWYTRVHAALDALWQDGALSRGDAYKRLHERMRKRGSMVHHVGDMTVDECRMALECINAIYSEIHAGQHVAVHEMESRKHGRRIRLKQRQGSGREHAEDIEENSRRRPDVRLASRRADRNRVHPDAEDVG